MRIYIPKVNRINYTLEDTADYWSNQENRLSFYRSPKWKRLRARVLALYGRTCMHCSSRDNINVDHIKPLKFHPRQRLKLVNLQVLCGDCNKKKLNNTMDYRTNHHLDILAQKIKKRVKPIYPRYHSLVPYRSKEVKLPPKKKVCVPEEMAKARAILRKRKDLEKPLQKGINILKL